MVGPNIGKGLFGEVFEAKSVGEQVYNKVVKVQGLQTKEKFETEVVILKKCSSKSSFPQHCGSFSLDNLFFIGEISRATSRSLYTFSVMSREGESIEDIVRRNHRGVSHLSTALKIHSYFYRIFGNAARIDSKKRCHMKSWSTSYRVMKTMSYLTLYDHISAMYLVVKWSGINPFQTFNCSLIAAKEKFVSYFLSISSASALQLRNTAKKRVLVRNDTNTNFHSF